jgi:hypothetical protein
MAEAEIDKCLAVLRTLISQGQTNGIVIAEKAINDYEASQPVAARKRGLQVIQTVVRSHRSSANTVPQRAFADTVIAYIEKRLRDP